jgi:hypothetical protein
MVAFNGLVGGITGGVGSAFSGAGIATQVAVGAGIGAGGSIAQQEVFTGHVDWGEVALSTGVGIAGAGAGSLLSKLAAAREVNGGVGAGPESGLTRVGRWMSPEEHTAMESTRMVRPRQYAPQVSVAHPASVEAYMRQAAPRSHYVEFDVPEASLVPGGKQGWAIIPGPDSIFSRLALKRGLPPYNYPPALNIEWVASKIRP